MENKVTGNKPRDMVINNCFTKLMEERGSEWMFGETSCDTYS